MTAAVLNHGLTSPDFKELKVENYLKIISECVKIVCQNICVCLSVSVCVCATIFLELTYFKSVSSDK